MKKLLTLAFFFPFFTLGQNLVLNGSFEDTISCPNSIGQLEKTNFWINPTLTTPDLMHTCSIFPGITAFGYQQPHSGDAFAGILPGTLAASVREYIETPLSNTLISGECYQLMFYANLGHYKFSTDAIHAYFSDTLIDNVSTLSVLNYNPQIRNQTGNFFDTLNWTLVQGEFEAIGGENFLIIGNFDSSAYCNWIIADSNSTINSCYIYIDDISLIQTTCTGLGENFGLAFELYPNPAFDFVTFTSNNDFNYEIKLFNSLAKFQLSTFLNHSSRIDFSKLPTGIYFYQIFYENAPVKFGKVVKVK